MEVNGWQLFVHPLLLQQLEKLVAAVERERARKPKSVQRGGNAKLLEALRRLLFETVPADPTRAEYRQGETLAPANKHWFRAKFGAQRFRLFFRFDSKAKVIIYAWVNDSERLRTYGADTDAYAVFRKMLDRGHPPTRWDELLGSSKPVDSDEKPSR